MPECKAYGRCRRSHQDRLVIWQGRGLSGPTSNCSHPGHQMLYLCVRRGLRHRECPSDLVVKKRADLCRGGFTRGRNRRSTNWKDRSDTPSFILTPPPPNCKVIARAAEGGPVMRGSSPCPASTARVCRFWSS